jgi:hypothetical protein
MNVLCANNFITHCSVNSFYFNQQVIKCCNIQSKNISVLGVNLALLSQFFNLNVNHYILAWMCVNFVGYLVLISTLTLSIILICLVFQVFHIKNWFQLAVCWPAHPLFPPMLLVIVQHVNM